MAAGRGGLTQRPHLVGPGRKVRPRCTAAGPKRSRERQSPLPEISHGRCRLRTYPLEFRAFGRRKLQTRRHRGGDRRRHRAGRPGAGTPPRTGAARAGWALIPPRLRVRARSRHRRSSSVTPRAAEAPPGAGCRTRSHCASKMRVSSALSADVAIKGRLGSRRFSSRARRGPRDRRGPAPDAKDGGRSCPRRIMASRSSIRCRSPISRKPARSSRSRPTLPTPHSFATLCCREPRLRFRPRETRRSRAACSGRRRFSPGTCNSSGQPKR